MAGFEREARVKRQIAIIASVASLLGIPSLWNNQVVNKHEPEKSKCALPGCEELTARGYCCAEHCKKHRKMLKEQGYL